MNMPAMPGFLIRTCVAGEQPCGLFGPERSDSVARGQHGARSAACPNPVVPTISFEPILSLGHVSLHTICSNDDEEADYGPREKAFALLTVTVLVTALCLAGCSQSENTSSAKVEQKTYPFVLQKTPMATPKFRLNL